MMFRQTYAKINTSALKNNVTELVNYYPEYKYYFGVVKGNAYGHGMKAVNALVAGGVNYLAVSSLEEAIKVREFDSETPILCLEPISVRFLSCAAENNATLTVDSLDYFKSLIKAHNKLKTPDRLKVHIKLDTGMNRLGIKEKSEVNALFALAGENSGIFIEGIYTHLATGGINDGFYDIQLERFKELTADIDLSAVPIVHIGRSLILVHHKKPDFVNGVRMGICMYGFSQSLAEPSGLRRLKRKLFVRQKSGEVIFGNSLKLNTAMALYSAVMAVKQVKKGEFIGYGAEYIASGDMTVATLPIGYFDGIDKGMKYVYLNGKRREILGEICMDMITVCADKDTKPGDIAEIFGEHISVREAARNMNTGAYRVLTGVRERVERIYE